MLLAPPLAGENGAMCFAIEGARPNLALATCCGRVDARTRTRMRDWLSTKGRSDDLRPRNLKRDRKATAEVVSACPGKPSLGLDAALVCGDGDL